MVQFCSHGQFMPGMEGADSLFENSPWENQYGRGRDFTLNLVWIRVSLEFYTKHKTPPPPGTDPYGFEPLEEE
jgi:hypothetical protein